MNGVFSVDVLNNGYLIPTEKSTQVPLPWKSRTASDSDPISRPHRIAFDRVLERVKDGRTDVSAAISTGK